MSSQSKTSAPKPLGRHRKAWKAVLVGLALLAVVAAGFAGCNALTHFTPAPAALQDKVDCLANADWLLHGEPTPAAVAGLMGSLPHDFVPVDVVECRQYFAIPTNTTTPTVPAIVETHFSGDFAPLLAALALPSDSGEENVNCTAQLEITPDLWLVNSDGKAVHVLWPKDACGFSKPGVAAALDNLTISSSTTLKVPAAQ